jgi:hypothetical protein
MVTAVTLVNSSLIGSTASTAHFFPGGRTALILDAIQYGPGVFLQVQNVSGSWISINGTTFSANQVAAYDLPAGQYRIVNNTGSSVTIAARLVGIPYQG